MLRHHHEVLFNELVLARYAQRPYNFCAGWLDVGIWPCISSAIHQKTDNLYSLLEIFQTILDYESQYKADRDLKLFNGSKILKKNVCIVFGPSSNDGQSLMGMIDSCYHYGSIKRREPFTPEGSLSPGPEITYLSDHTGRDKLERRIRAQKTRTAESIHEGNGLS